MTSNIAYEEEEFEPTRYRFTTALRIYTNLDHYPTLPPAVNLDLYYVRLLYLNQLKKKGTWRDNKNNLESMAYSIVEVRKCFNNLHSIATSIRAMQKMVEDKTGSSTVFLLRLLAKYELNHVLVKSLLKLEFGFNPPSYMMYQAKKQVKNILENIWPEEAKKFMDKDPSLINRKFSSGYRCVPRTPFIPDFDALSKLRDLYRCNY